jgi:hypothetical protein
VQIHKIPNRAKKIPLEFCHCYVCPNQGIIDFRGENMDTHGRLNFLNSQLGFFPQYIECAWKTLPQNLRKIALTALILLGRAFLIFTFYPPHLQPFQDPITGAYRIINQ